MPKCLNDPSAHFKGDEPSPKGYGYCAHGEKQAGVIRHSLDKKKSYITKLVKSKTGKSLRWVVFSDTYVVSQRRTIDTVRWRKAYIFFRRQAKKRDMTVVQFANALGSKMKETYGMSAADVIALVKKYRAQTPKMSEATKKLLAARAKRPGAKKAGGKKKKAGAKKAKSTVDEAGATPPRKSTKPKKTAAQKAAAKARKAAAAAAGVIKPKKAGAKSKKAGAKKAGAKKAGAKSKKASL